MSQLAGFTDSFRAIFDLGRVAGTPIPWTKEQGLITKLIFAAYHTIVVVYLTELIFCTSYAAVNFQKLEEMTQCVSCLGIYSLGYCLPWFYYLRGDKFKGFIAETDRISRLIQESGFSGASEFAKMYQKDSRFLIQGVKIEYLVMLAILVCYTLIAPFKAAITGEGYGKLTLPTHCPFEVGNPKIYELLILGEFVGFYIPCCNKTTHEFMMLGIFKVYRAFYLFLTLALREMNEDVRMNRRTEYKRKMKTWIELHKAIQSNVLTIVSIFSPVIVLYYISVLVNVAAGMFFSLNNDGSLSLMNSVVEGAYMGLTVFLLYIQCHVAEEMTTEADNMNNELFKITWYELDERDKKTIKMIATATNRIIMMRGYEIQFFTLNKEQFVSLMVNMISTYMAFDKVIMRHKLRD